MSLVINYAYDCTATAYRRRTCQDTPTLRLAFKVGKCFFKQSNPNPNPNPNPNHGIQGAKVFFQTVVEYLKRAKPEAMVEKLPLVGSHREARRNIDFSAEKVIVYWLCKLQCVEFVTSYYWSYGTG